jgi:hypothetical protein
MRVVIQRGFVLIKLVKQIKRVRVCDNPKCEKPTGDRFVQYHENMGLTWDYCNMTCLLQHLNWLAEKR